MSGFDKEAERERLREKYEQDQESRAATQRMSELLLQGATMTNSHCDTCGDPIFRYDGQEFCPTCQADAAEAGGDAAAPGEEASETAPAEQAPAADAGATERQPATDADRRPAADERPRTESTARDLVPDERGADQPTQTDAPLETAQASLSRTLVRYAQAAEETDDPRQAKELLAAAREAAETLSALRR